MANFKEIVDQQNTLGEAIQAVCRRLKKDPHDRKTRTYLDNNTQELESSWGIFQQNHEDIQQYESENQDHPYYRGKYFEAIQVVYQRTKTLIQGAEAKLEAVTKPAAKQKELSFREALTISKNPNNHPSEPERFKVPSEELNEDTNFELVKLVRKQKTLMKNAVYLIRDIESKADHQHPQPYYELKINMLQECESQMSETDQSIWETTVDEAPDGYNSDHYNELRCWLHETVAKLKQRLINLSDQNGSPMGAHQGLSSQIQLPKITLPSFDGNYLKWTQFHDLYTQLIHSQPISDSQKMYYLINNLTGEAKRLIQHLPISNENYKDAWTIIQDRYDNKRLLVTNLLSKLLSQSPCQNESATSIKSLHDTTNECVLGLKNLGLAIDTWDPILLHLLIKKLDRNTHALYEQSLESPRELSTMKIFLAFLEGRFQSLEALGGRNAMSTIQRSTKSSSLVTAPTFDQCVVCTLNHPLYFCKTFLSQSPKGRFQLVKKYNLCNNCLKAGHTTSECSSRSCKKCTKKHNTLLHLDDSSKGARKPEQRVKSIHSTAESNSRSSTSSPSTNMREGDNTTTLAAQITNNCVLLSTVLVKVFAVDGQEQLCRAVLDSGSQLNFITENMATRLGLAKIPGALCIQGIGQSTQKTQSKVHLLLESRITGFSTQMDAFILPKIANQQPAQFVDITSWKIPNNVKLADPQFYQPKKIDLLIGAELYFQLLSVGQIQLGSNLPTLQNTVFGWIIAGRVANVNSSKISCGICCHEVDKLAEKVQDFWQLDEVNPASQMTSHEKKCEEHFTRTTIRETDGRFTVRLPFTQEPNVLGESKDIALKRFFSLERKLSKDENLKRQYVEFMQEYLRLGHMEEVNIHEISKPYYFLPHHPVLRPDSITTKLRVVFDASAKTSTNIALNEVLHTGPALQEDLVSVLLRFRLPRFVFTADVEKMYRQVRLNEDDRKYQLIAWRNDQNKPIQYYQLSTVTYGVTTAPYLAIKCLRRLASETEGSYLLGSNIIRKNMYVDDVMTGSDSLRESIEMQDQLKKVLKSGGFKLRKWCANHPQLLQNIPSEDRALQFNVEDQENCHIKTLGLTWLPKGDDFCIKTYWPEGNQVTKRTVSSDIAHLFDPLGVMSPVVISAKIFLQSLWKLKLNWDAAVPMEMHSRWIQFRQELRLLEDIKFPRHLFSGKTPYNIQMHAFSDASERAYGAAVYIRSQNEDGTTVVRLLCAKSKVAPTKTTTLPRLELQAATLAAKLATRVKGELQWNNLPCWFWTDSEIVLAWLHSPSSSCHTFVANRVSTIQELTSIDQWRHVPSQSNPADMVSRGISPAKLKENYMWFYGPMFLHGSENIWPLQPSRFETTLEKKNAKVALAVYEERDFITAIDHRNSFQHLQRVIAYVLRFIKNSRPVGSSHRATSHLTVEELEAATTIIIKKGQGQHFSEDLASLRKHNKVDGQSSLSTLSPFLDNNGIIRVGGRLEKADIQYDAKHPMLLPYNHIITRLLMTELHLKNSHVGPQGLLAITRQRFWPIKGKTMARSIVLSCVQCTKAKPKLLSQLMGNLPATRVQPARPFVNAGVDFCGPFWTHYKVRGKKPQKTYIAVFVCFATKAVHLEVVSDLTTNAFIGALKRFVSRRGNCRHLYCDNATNFVGARNQLEELKEAIYNKDAEKSIIKFCTSKGTEFHFIPPRAPHFGGLWEAAVKSAKNLLPRTVSNVELTYEELGTVIAEIEAILNSRPITPMSADPNDLTALTPGHFLIGEPLTSIADPLATPVRSTLQQHWKRIFHVKHQFWQRWVKEYLTELQYRHKWKRHCHNVEAGTMVIIKDNNLPVLKWPLGRIINTIKGNDGLIRVADVKTESGVLRRPIHNLAPLPIESEIQDQHPSPDDGNSSNKEQAGRITTYATPSSTEPSKRTTRDDSRITEVPRNAKKRRRNHSVLSLALLTCLILPIMAEQQVKITPFASDPGLYFEKMGAAHLVSNEWNLVIYFNMTTYWKELGLINRGITNLNQICSKIIHKQSCAPTVSQLTDSITEIQIKNELLRHNTHSRWRRAPLNFIGSISNSLFGILDASYAAEMEETIKHLEGNDQHLLDLLRNQTTVIDSTVNVMRKSHETMERQLKEFDGYLNKTINQLNAVNEELHERSIAEYFNTLTIRLVLLSINYQRMQSALFDVLIDSHHGKVNPQLLTPEQLRAQLLLIKESIPSTLRLPAKQDELLKIYGLMTIEGRIMSNQIIFRIKLPLFTYDQFELLRVIPVPVIANGTFLTINPSTRFLIINLHRDLYYPMSEQEISSCGTIDYSEHICKQQHPLYRKDSNISNCEVAFLMLSTSSPSCELINSSSVPRWIQLLNPNHWIYVFKQETTINIVCGDAMFTRTLFGSGIINVTKGCTIKEDSAVIQATNSYHSGIVTSFTPSKFLSDVLGSPKNLTILHHPTPSRSIEEDVSNLTLKIKQLLNEEAALPSDHHQHIHHYSVGYTSLLITIIILSYLLWKFRMERCRRRRPLAPVPAPRQIHAEAFKVDPEIHI